MSAESSATPTAPAPLLVLGLAAFSSMATMRACDPLLPKLASQWAVTTGVAAQTITAFATAYGLAQFVYGPLGDRHGRTRVMAWAALAAALANLAVAMAPDFEWALVGRIAAGVACGGIVPLSLALIGDTVAFEHRQPSLARLMLTSNLGVIAGQWLGGWVGETWGWRAVFLLLSACFAVAAGPLFLDARRRAPPVAAAAGHGWARAAGGFSAVLRNRWARVLLAIVLAEGALVFASLAFVPSFLHDRYGLSLGEAGAVMALYGAAGLLYTPAAGWLVRRAGERRVAGLGAGVIGLGTACLALSSHWAHAVPGCLLAGLGFFMLHTTIQAHATQLSPEHRGTGVSLFVLSLFGGQALGVAVAAAVVDLASPRWVFACSAIGVPLLGWVFVRALARPGLHGLPTIPK